jgi:hypothetical protein
MILIGLGVLTLKSSWAESSPWNGLLFECEFSGRQAPPGDDCAMLDDDGFFFEEGQVTYMKVIDSPEADSCKKQRPGQCVRADQPSVTVVVQRKGKAEFSDTTIGLSFLGCTQIYHMTKMKSFFEARPDDNRCFWAGEKYFYLRKYDGTVTIED